MRFIAAIDGLTPEITCANPARASVRLIDLLDGTTCEELAMTSDEWVKRCADRFIVRGGLDSKQAADAAAECFDASSCGAIFDPMANYNPEACADEEMSYWTDDGE